MQFVDKEDDLPFALLHFRDDGFEPLFEFAAEFCTCDEGTQIEGEEPFVFQAFGNVARCDAPGKSFDDRRLSDAGFADEYGIVFRPTAKHLHDAPDLFVASDNRIDFVLTCKGGQIAAEFFKRAHRRFGIVARYLLIPAHGFQRFQNRLSVDAVLSQHIADSPVRFAHRKENMLRRKVFVVQIRHRFFRLCKRFLRFG